jgi:type II secretory pathway component GspD/PulD (secretin)
MLSNTSRRPALGLAAALCLALYAVCWTAPGRADKPEPPKSDNAPAKNKRTFYIVKYGSAKDLAPVLAKHFKDDAEVQALPEPSSNCLLISAAPGVFDEVVKLLEQLDRRPQLLAVDLLVAEILPRKDKDGKPIAPDKEADESEFKGTMADVVAKLKEMRKDGQGGESIQLQLTTVENQEASALVGASKPYVMGATRTGTGITARNIAYRDAGTQARVKARVAPDKTVTLDLRLEHARPHTPDDGIPVGNDENNKPIVVPEFSHSTFNDQVSIPAGQAVLLKGVKTTSKSGQVRMLVFAAARVVEPSGK